MAINRRIKQIILLILPFIGAILNRLGGMAGMNTKFRDFGVALVGFFVIILLGIKVAWWIHLISFLLFFSALTSYEYGMNTDNFYLHGFFTSFAYLPYAIAAHLWVMFIVRVIIATVSIGGVNYFVNKYKWKHSDWVEELSRGGILIGTLFLFK